MKFTNIWDLFYLQNVRINKVYLGNELFNKRIFMNLMTIEIYDKRNSHTHTHMHCFITVDKNTYCNINKIVPGKFV